MHGRKKQLLYSYKTSVDSSAGGLPHPSTSHHPALAAGDMSAASLNLNQSLTEQLTQHRRSHVDGGGSVAAVASRRTPIGDAVGGGQPAPSTRVDLDVVEGRCGRTVPSPSVSASARGSHRSRDPDEPPPKPAAASRPPAPRSPDPGALGPAAFPPGIDPVTARLALQHQLGLFPHPALHPPPPPSFLLPPDSGVVQHLELLYRFKYPGYPVPPPWLLCQYQDELVRDAALIQQQQQQQQATSERLEHGLRERDRVDNDRNAIKERQERSVFTSC